MSELNLGPRPRDKKIVGLAGIETGEGVTGVSKGTGRLPAPDIRDGAYRFKLVKRQIPKIEGASRTFRHWSVDKKRLPIDQAATPRCVGFSITTTLVVGPVTQLKTIRTRDDAQRLADEIYIRALDVDEWEGNDPNFGTSVRAGAKVAVAMGYAGGYAWGESVDDVVEFLLNHGPVNMGTLWPDSMMNTDKNGYLVLDPASAMDGQHAQGHAWSIDGVNTKEKNPDGSTGYVEMWNTWGLGWGRKATGSARASFRTLGALLLADGEAMFLTEKELKPAFPVKIGNGLSATSADAA